MHRGLKNVKGGRIYLNSRNLVLSDEGIFLIDETNQKIPLPFLLSDAHGIYTSSETLETHLAALGYPVWCRTCEGWRYIGPRGKCPVCGNTP